MSSKPKGDAFAIAASLNQAAAAPAQDNVPPATRKATRGAALPPSRQGKRVLSGYFPEATTYKAVQMLVAEEGSSVQALLEEALADLLVKRGKTKYLRP
jgi:hypothetical protein